MCYRRFRNILKLHANFLWETLPGGSMNPCCCLSLWCIPLPYLGPHALCLHVGGGEWLRAAQLTPVLSVGSAACSKPFSNLRNHGEEHWQKSNKNALPESSWGDYVHSEKEGDVILWNKYHQIRIHLFSKGNFGHFFPKGTANLMSTQAHLIPPPWWAVSPIVQAKTF